MTDEQNYKIRVATYDKVKTLLENIEIEVRENTEVDPETRDLIAYTLKDIRHGVAAFTPPNRQEPEEDFIITGVEPRDSDPFSIWSEMGSDVGNNLGIAANLANGSYKKKIVVNKAEDLDNLELSELYGYAASDEQYAGIAQVMIAEYEQFKAKHGIE